MIKKKHNLLRSIVKETFLFVSSFGFFIFLFLPNQFRSQQANTNNNAVITERILNTEASQSLYDNDVISVIGGAYIFVSQDKDNKLKSSAKQKLSRSTRINKKNVKKIIAEKVKTNYLQKKSCYFYLPSPESIHCWSTVKNKNSIGLSNSSNNYNLIVSEFILNKDVPLYSYKSKLKFMFSKEFPIWKFFRKHTSRPPPALI